MNINSFIWPRRSQQPPATKEGFQVLENATTAYGEWWKCLQTNAVRRCYNTAAVGGRNASTQSSDRKTIVLQWFSVRIRVNLCVRSSCPTRLGTWSSENTKSAWIFSLRVLKRIFNPSCCFITEVSVISTSRLRDKKSSPCFLP